MDKSRRELRKQLTSNADVYCLDTAAYLASLHEAITLTAQGKTVAKIHKPGDEPPHRFPIVQENTTTL